jgi:hypothetical protein
MTKARPTVGKAREVRAGEKLGTRPSDSRNEPKAARPTGKISNAFGLLKRPNGPRLSIQEINDIAGWGWSGKR